MLSARGGSVRVSETHFLSKSRVMAKFCQAVSSMGVDQTSVFCLLSTLNVFLLPDRPMMVPVWKLNWLEL